MKRLFTVLLPIALIFSLFACSVPDVDRTITATSPNATQTPDIFETPAIISFSDANLEARIRKSMDKPEGPITLQEASEVLSLDLSGSTSGDSFKDSAITDIDSLKYFKNVFRLDLSFNAIEDIGALSELTGLRILNLTGNSISDISPLSELNLTDLSTSNNQIADVTPLSGMRQLSYLDLGGNAVTNIKPISELHQLSYLNVSNNQVDDFSPLAGLTRLENVFLSGNPAEDFSPLADIYSSLKTTDFVILSDHDAVPFSDPVLETAIRAAMDRPDGDITLAEAKTVEALNLDFEVVGDIIQNIDALRYFTGLTELDMDNVLHSNEGSFDFSPLANLKNLENLSVVSCGLIDLSPLKNLRQLNYFDATWNEIKTVEPLSGLTNLQTLLLEGNSISDISPLAGLTGYKCFWWEGIPFLIFLRLEISRSFSLWHLAQRPLPISVFSRILPH
jgi:internalin A